MVVTGLNWITWKTVDREKVQYLCKTRTKLLIFVLLFVLSLATRSTTGNCLKMAANTIPNDMQIPFGVAPCRATWKLQRTMQPDSLHLKAPLHISVHNWSQSSRLGWSFVHGECCQIYLQGINKNFKYLISFEINLDFLAKIYRGETDSVRAVGVCPISKKLRSFFW